MTGITKPASKVAAKPAQKPTTKGEGVVSIEDRVAATKARLAEANEKLAKLRADVKLAEKAAQDAQVAFRKVAPLLPTPSIKEQLDLQKKIGAKGPTPPPIQRKVAKGEAIPKMNPAGNIK